jgi:hypothetical protein
MELQRSRQSRIITLLRDLTVVAWSAAWIVAGIAVADFASALTDLSDAVIDVGGAVAETGDTVVSIDVPLVGGGLDEAGGNIATQGRDIEAAGTASRDELERFIILIGLAVALVPTLPVLAWYLPPRVAAARNVRAVKAMLLEGGDDAELERFLATRAVGNLPYRELTKVSKAPLRDLDEGRWRKLADLELGRIGLVQRQGRV